MDQATRQEELIELAMRQGGTLNLDLSLDFHYEFFVGLFGGEGVLKRSAPELYANLRWQREVSRQLGDNPLGLGLRDSAQIKDFRVAPVQGMHALWGLRAVPTASYVQEPKSLTVHTSIYDVTRKRILSQDMGKPNYNPQSRTYSRTVSSTVNDDGAIRYRKIRASASFVFGKPHVDGRMVLGGLIAATDAETPSCNGDIKSVTLHDPIIKNAGKRTHHTNYVCISYNRKSQMQSPDYESDLTVESGVYAMPVDLPISFTVELQNKAYFQKVKGSYFKTSYNPNISLTRFTIENSEMVLGGSAILKQDWVEVSKNKDIVKVEDCVAGQTDMPNKIRFTLPRIWKSSLVSDTVMNIGTEAELYGYIPLNTVNYNGDQPMDGTTTIILKREEASNPNEVKVAPIYFQWGCIARDVALLTGTGRRTAAQDIRIGDGLMNRDGKTIRVIDIFTGMEERLLQITTAGGRSVRVTKDHTICTAGVGAMAVGKAACDVREESAIYVWDETAGKPVVDQVVSVQLVEYNDMVYNFRLEESDYLVGNGILIGDISLQENIRPELEQPEYPVTPEMAVIMGQMRSLLGEQKPYPDFQSSNQPESYQMHYFAVKTLACSAMFSESQAQVIAEFCQFLSDNATTGGVIVEHLEGGRKWCNAEKFFRNRTEDEGFEVPILPTAMRQWYDDIELKERKPWFSGQALGTEQEFDVDRDILGPCHFFLSDVAEETPGVVFNPENLSKKMDALAREVAAYKDAPQDIPRVLLIKMGVYLHILLDTKMHEHFCAPKSWINMALRSSVEGPDGDSIEASYPAYKQFEESFFEQMEDVPAGLQRISWAVNETFASLSYEYPLSSSSLGDHSMGFATWGNYAAPNYKIYARACGAALHFLEKCLGKEPAENWTDSELYGCLVENFQSKKVKFDELKRLWSKNFTTNNYHYDAEKVYKSLFSGGGDGTDQKDPYGDFFAFQEILFRLWQEQRGLQNNLKLTQPARA